MSKDLIHWQNLQSLNLSDIPLSVNVCRSLSSLLILSHNLKDLNLASCKISYQGTRYILDGLNRNESVSYFNFSFNDLQSSMYEFSIKLAKIVSRHVKIMHINVTCTGLKKEEVIFLGFALAPSKSLVAIHMSANDLDYYERVFIRTCINAKVLYHFRNHAEDKNVRSFKEQNQLIRLQKEDERSQELQDFITAFNFIDNQRLGLDEEINDIINNLNLEKTFNNYDKQVFKDDNQDDPIANLVEKIRSRTEKIQKQKSTVQSFHDENLQQS